MKKKLVAAIVAAALACFGVMALAGCGGSSSSSSESTDTASSAASTANIKTVEDGTLTVITSADYQPMEYMDGDDIKGFDPDLIKAIGEKLGLKVSIKSQSFDSLITAIAGGTSADCAISAITINDERQEQVDLSDPYYDSNLAIVVMGNNKDLKSKSDLNAKGVKIAAQSGSSGEDWAKENCKKASYTPFQETPDMLAALRTGKIDAAIYDDPVAETHVNGEYKDCKILEVIPTGEQYGIAVNKDNPELTAAINQCIKEMKEDGTIEQIEKDNFK